MDTRNRFSIFDSRFSIYGFNLGFGTTKGRKSRSVTAPARGRMTMRCALICLLIAGCATTDPAPDPSSILKVLTDQAEAWNRGDLETFLDGYWRSEQTVFAGGGTVHRGLDAMAARYRKTYDTPGKMGKLTLAHRKFESIERDRAVVTGSWDLERAKDKPGGVFTLIFRRLPEGWRIAHDHTSSR